MTTGIVTATYIVASILFILSLGGLNNQESAKRAIWYGMAGMFLAVVATLFGPGISNYPIVIVMVVAGSGIGYAVARRVEMTEMPQLVAALHSFVGLAAVLIGLNADVELSAVSGLKTSGVALADVNLTGFALSLFKKTMVEVAILKVEILLGIFIGAVTFTGSLVAFGKLAGSVDGKPFKLPGGHLINLLGLLLCICFGFLYLKGSGIWTLILVVFISGLIG